MHGAHYRMEMHGACLLSLYLLPVLLSYFSSRLSPNSPHNLQALSCLRAEIFYFPLSHGICWNRLWVSHDWWAPVLVCRITTNTGQSRKSKEKANQRDVSTLKAAWKSTDRIPCKGDMAHYLAAFLVRSDWTLVPQCDVSTLAWDNWLVLTKYERRRQWHPTPVLLLGKSHGRRSLVGCSPWGHKEFDTTERLHFHFSLSCIGGGNGNPLQCSCLENSRDGGAWWPAVYGVAQSRTWLKWLSSSSRTIYSM